MEFVWDSSNIAHIAQHTVSPAEAEQVVTSNPFDLERQIRNGEERILHLGETTAGRILFVVVTLREDKTRIVTAFPADKKARRFYSEQKDANDGQSYRDP